MLGRFNEDVSALTKAIRKGDGDARLAFRPHPRHPQALSISAKIHRRRFGRPHPDLPHQPLLKPYGSED